jgi:iron complex outermembrane recepter protein
MCARISRSLKRLALQTLPAAWLVQSAFSQSDSRFTNAPGSVPGAPDRLPEIVVTAPREVPGPVLPEGASLNSWSADTSPEARNRALDSASLLRDAPGAAVVRNGPQTGIVQLRGLSGDRVKVSVDGMTITPACPNHMDPPLHYAAPSAVNTITIMAGITPVSLGGDSLGGTVLVEPSPLRFATNEHLLWSGELGSFYRSSNDGYGVNGAVGVANQKISAAYDGSWQTADDLRFPGGRVRDTGYDTQQHNVETGFQTRQGVWSIDAGLVRTRDAGTPALPMDMIKDDGYRIGLKHAGDYSFGSVQGRFYYHTIDHRMDNYSLRPLAAGAMPMFSPATSDDTGLNLGVSLPRDRHTFRLGTGFHLNQFDAYQQNAISGAQQDTFNDASRARVGTYAEWQADWSTKWSTLLGVRNDTVMSDAGDIHHTFPASAADQAAFNARSHDLLYANFDATATVRLTANSWSTYEIGLACKNRAPSLLELYLWTPLSASAGQADGRTYLGNLDLDSETSYQIAGTADWHGERWQLKAAPFYNFVYNYIQGMPASRLDSSGNPVLEFQNLDRADLYGAEGSARYYLITNFAISGTVSYVRGINRDNDDNLYRIAPLRGTIALDHRLGGWKNNLEVVLVDSQDEVAAYNGETPTPGYALLNLRTGYTWRKHLNLQVGLENVFDERYSDHLGGINRVLNSDVAVGEHIPGAGRFVYVAVNYQY